MRQLAILTRIILSLYPNSVQNAVKFFTGPTYYAEELTSDYSSMIKPQYKGILTLCTCYSPPPSR